MMSSFFMLFKMFMDTTLDSSRPFTNLLDKSFSIKSMKRVYYKYEFSILRDLHPA